MSAFSVKIWVEKARRTLFLKQEKKYVDGWDEAQT